MPSPAQLYQSVMHTNIGLFATWLPGDPIAPGDIGVLSNGQFKKQSSLAELGISFAKEPGGRLDSIYYTSTKGTRIENQAGATFPGLARAEIKVEFSSEGAFLFHAAGLVARRIKERAALERKVFSCYRKGHWRSEWYLVNSTRTADLATVMVSQDSLAEVVLAASVPKPLAVFSLVDPEVKLQICSTRGKMLQIIGACNLILLYSCLRVVDPFFGKAALQPVRGPETLRGLALQRPAIDALLYS